MGAYVKILGTAEIAVSGLLSLILGLILTGLFTKEQVKNTIPMYVVLTIGISGIFFGAFVSLETILGWRVGIPLLLLQAALIFAAWHAQFRLLPDPKVLLTVQEKEQRRGFYIRMTEILVELCLLNVGMWFLPSARVGIWIVLLYTAICIAFLAVARNFAFDAQKQVESLIDQKYQSELLGFMQVIRSQRHDFNFHMQAISGLIENGEYEKCDEYIHTMVRKTTAMNDILPIAHPAVSAMLCSFREIAAQKGIRMDLDISDNLEKIPCSVYEVNTVIGNLIQNAIDEVETHEPDRAWIQVLILKRGGIYSVKVTNPCDRSPEDLKNCFRAGVSSKQSHEGIGLANVTRIAERYHGSAFLELGTGTVSFIAQLAGTFR